tara:strand:+ start:7088 stop:7486 length:399 start_codon:yes stop_codon:yes gene_type:complete
VLDIEVNKMLIDNNCSVMEISGAFIIEAKNGAVLSTTTVITLPIIIVVIVVVCSRFEVRFRRWIKKEPKPASNIPWHSTITAWLKAIIPKAFGVSALANITSTEKLMIVNVSLPITSETPDANIILFIDPTC